ncbi:hypothetical protein VP01_32g2 [Puccinia sorghi]|uniref:Uncharacterized protein n=1 Tax=Puccinia sorghi TaxID=27349 RepID=A0A0L6UXD6_9BASI|nr:hypothetical protein VP01_32g2 [Puccinia sorghi]
MIEKFESLTKSKPGHVTNLKEKFESLAKSRGVGNPQKKTPLVFNRLSSHLVELLGNRALVLTFQIKQFLGNIMSVMQSRQFIIMKNILHALRTITPKSTQKEIELSSYGCNYPFLP